MLIDKKIEQIKSDFDILPGWEERYEYIISLGRNLAPLATEFKTDEYLVRGCQSRVWMRAYKKDEKVFYEADSDALITKGIIALLLAVVNGASIKEVANIDFGFLDDIGLKSHLSMSRVNGLQSMIKKIKSYYI